MRFYCATRFLFPYHFSLRIFFLCFVCVHLPILAYAGAMVWLGTWSWGVFVPILLATVLGTAVAVGGMAGLLAPIRIATDQLGRVQRGERVERVPVGGPDMAGQLLAAVENAASATREQIETMRGVAGSDPLTGLHNRRGFTDNVLPVLAGGTSGTLAVLDCDRFKQVNDRLGHAAGDRALRAIASAIREHSRATDIAARWGGDEFVIFFADCGLIAAKRLIEGVLDTLEQRPAALIDGAALRFSYGIAPLASGGDWRKVDEALDAADRMLYVAKRSPVAA